MKRSNQENTNNNNNNTQNNNNNENSNSNKRRCIYVNEETYNVLENMQKIYSYQSISNLIEEKIIFKNPYMKLLGNSFFFTTTTQTLTFFFSIYRVQLKKITLWSSVIYHRFYLSNQ